MKLKACFSNKSGNVFFEGMTIFYWIVMLIIFGIVGLMLFTEVNIDFQSDPTNSASAKEIVQDAFDSYPSMWDDVIITAFIGLWLFALISAYFIDTSPLFFVVSLVLLIILLMVIVYAANSTYDIFTADGFVEYYEQFPKTNFIFENILIVTTLIGVTITLALYAKR